MALIGKWAAVTAIAGFIVSPTGLRAEGEETSAKELFGYTGVTFGSIGAHPAVGASSGISLSRYAICLLDLSYMPLGSDTLQSYPRQVLVNSSGLFDLSLSVHIRVPLRHKWEPYGIVGPAFLFSTYQVAKGTSQGGPIYASRSDSDAGFETGGGLRYYAGKHWGVRTELRYTISHRSFGRLLAGVFYQFEGDSFWLRLRGRNPGAGFTDPSRQK